jgi:hypothetical protein
MVAARRHTGDDVVLNMQVQAAAAAAPGTGRGDLIHMLNYNTAALGKKQKRAAVVLPPLLFRDPTD